MRKRFLLRIIGSGALALLICLLLWWLFDIDPFNWIALAAMIASAREAIIKAHQRMYKLKDDAEPSSLLIDSGLVPADLFGRSRA
jgi:hypothetical protein